MTRPLSAATVLMFQALPLGGLMKGATSTTNRSNSQTARAVMPERRGDGGSGARNA